MDIGELDGLTFAEVRVRYPGLLEEWVSGPGPSMLMPGGERLVDVQERAWAAVTELAARHPEDAVAAVSHNFVILSLLTKVLGWSCRVPAVRHAVAQCRWWIRPGAALVVRMNDTCHLDGG
jgi:broad specificity phosphatase PhoE